jgi:hypothetical protein
MSSVNRVSLVLRRTGLAVYENLPACVGVSVAWTIPVLPGVFLMRMPLGGAYVVFAALTGIVPAFRFVYLTLRRKRMRRELFWQSAPRMLARGAAIAAVGCVVYTIAYSTWWYYLASPSTLRFILAMVQSYLLGMFVMSSVYVPALLAFGELKVGDAFLESFRLFFTNTGYSLLLWVQLLTLTVFLLVTTIGFALLFAGVAGALLCLACEELIRPER